MSGATLPQPFRERMSALLQEDYPSFLQSYDEPRPSGLRVNTLKITAQDFAARWPWTLEPIPWAADGFFCDYTTYPGRHPYHLAGVYYLQEPSAMAVLHYLDPQPRERILDLAAAPGGKATAIASRLRQQGLLWANEINSSRARILAQNLERWGAANAIVSNESPDKLAQHLSSYFDRILLDAPCSGEGMFRKDLDAIKDWSPEHVSSCATRQGLILESAALLLKPGGRLVYSTCTFSPEENEVAILRFLDKHPEFRPLCLSDPAPGYLHPKELPQAVRLYPHRLQGEGHFIVALEKSGAACETNALNGPHEGSPGKSSPKRPQRKKPPFPQGKGSPRDVSPFTASLEAFLEAFLEVFLERTELNKPPEELSASLRRAFIGIADSLPGPSNPPSAILPFGNHLYLSPDPSLSLAGLSILRPGLHLGENKPGRFQPSQALALALQPHQVREYLALSPEDPRCQAYLRGETLPSPGTEGWVLVGIDTFPLGWGKRVNGELKNHYPKELRTDVRPVPSPTPRDL